MSCRILLQTNGTCRVIRLEGVGFSPAQQPELRASVRSILDRSPSDPLALRTDSLDVVGSCCLSALIEAVMACRRQGTPVVVVEDRTSVLEMFEVVSLPSLVEIVPRLEFPTAPLHLG